MTLRRAYSLPDTVPSALSVSSYELSPFISIVSPLRKPNNLLEITQLVKGWRWDPKSGRVTPEIVLDHFAMLARNCKVGETGRCKAVWETCLQVQMDCEACW